MGEGSAPKESESCYQGSGVQGKQPPPSGPSVCLGTPAQLRGAFGLRGSLPQAESQPGLWRWGSSSRTSEVPTHGLSHAGPW